MPATAGRWKTGCPCPACRHSRGYLRHLFLADEMLGPILLSLHNLTYYQRLLADARAAIADGRFAVVRRREAAGAWQPGGMSDASAAACGALVPFSVAL